MNVTRIDVHLVEIMCRHVDQCGRANRTARGALPGTARVDLPGSALGHMIEHAVHARRQR